MTVSKVVAQSGPDLHIQDITNQPLRREGRWCSTNGSWKDKDLFSENRWYSILEGFDGLLGAKNNRYSQLVKMISETEE